MIHATNADYILVTRGSSGMLLAPKNGSTLAFPGLACEVFDVSGAGDTVASALAAALGASARIDEAVTLANLAAGIVVGTGVADAALVQQPRNFCSHRRSLHGRRRWRAHDLLHHEAAGFHRAGCC